MRSVLRGALVGAASGLAVFLADAAVTALSHSRRFESRWETFVLLALIAAACVVAGALAGLLLTPLVARLGRRAWVLPIAALVASGGLLYAIREAVPRSGRPLSAAIRAEAPRDVVWIVVDTLRADALYGPGSPIASGVFAADEAHFPYAPNLAALASEGSLFTQAEAPSGWTLPSTAALLTGVAPGRLGARRGLLPRGAETAAELLRAAGWRTLAHVDNTLLDESNGFAAGFERFEKRSPMDFGWRLRTARLLPKRVSDELRHSLPISYSGAEALVDRAVRDLEAAGDAPLFLYVHAMDVHAPYWSELEDAALAAAAETLPGLDGTGRDLARKDEDFLTEQQQDALRALYAAELEHVDREIGRLLARFDELRGLEDALVVVTSDHGEEFWEHGKMGHGHALYGEVARVPLLLHVPADLAPAAPSVVDAPASLLDVLPTVADLVGLRREDGEFAFDGRSLAPLLRGAALPDVPLHAEQFRFNRTTHRWREGELVLVRTELPDDRLVVRLYDAVADPGEQHDLATERPEDVARLAQALDAHLATLQRDAFDAGSAVRNERGLQDLGY